MRVPSRSLTLHRGFTLIELLVVIAIIAILAAILVPAVHTALERARFIHCTSNIGQLAKAAYQYATSHDGAMPSANWTSASTGWLYSHRMDRPEDVERGDLWEYVGARMIYRCPGDPQPDPNDQSIPNRPRNSRMITSYCMNGSVVSYGRNEMVGGGRLPRQRTWLIEDFRADDILFWEPDETKSGGFWWDGANYPWEGISRRHLDRASVANVDGSSHGMELSEFYAMADPSPQQRDPEGRNRLYNVPNSPTGDGE